jgi:integrase/recombinase XerD
MTPLRKQFLDCMQVRHYAEKTKIVYVQWVYRLAKAYHRSPDELSDDELKNFIWSLSLEQHLSASTCAQAFHALNFFYQKVLGRTFAVKLLPPMKRQQKIPELLNFSEVKRIIDACTSLKYRTIFVLCYGCGLRVSELTTIRLVDIDGEQKVLHLHQAKGGKDRRIPVSETLLSRLRLYWLHYRPTYHFFYGNLIERPLSISTIQKAFSKAKKRAGVLKSGGIHGLRHAYATHQLMAGMPLPELQYNLGHKDISSTLHYTHWLPHYHAVQATEFDLVERMEQTS